MSIMSQDRAADYATGMAYTFWLALIPLPLSLVMLVWSGDWRWVLTGVLFMLVGLFVGFAMIEQPDWDDELDEREEREGRHRSSPQAADGGPRD